MIMHTIGITGEIGTGKSLIANILREKGFEIIDVEEVLRKVLESGRKVRKEIRNNFGNRFFDDENGGIFKKEALISHLADNKYEELQKVYAGIIESVVFKETMRQVMWHMVRVKKLIFLVIPQGMNYFDMFLSQKIFISCNKEVQLRRVMTRDGISEDEALKMINANIISSRIPRMQRQFKEADLGYIDIDNNKSIEETEAQVDKMIKDLNFKAFPFVFRLFICPTFAVAFGATAYSAKYLARACFTITTKIVDPILDLFKQDDNIFDELDAETQDDDSLKYMELYYRKVLKSDTTSKD